MKVEVTTLEAGVAPRADGSGEAHIRVLSHEPFGPEAWDRVALMAEDAHPGLRETYESKYESFFADLTEIEEGETAYDAEGHGFEQWFVLKERKVYTK